MLQVTVGRGQEAPAVSVIVTQVGAGLDEPPARTLMGKVARTAPRKGNTGNCIFDDTLAVTIIVLFSDS
jgi:hypothetical protein